MIKIQIPNRDSFEEKHFSAISSVCQKRVEFCITLFSVALGKASIDKRVSKIEQHFGIHALTANSIVKGLVSPRKRKAINQNTILGFLKGQDQSLLSKSRRKYEFIAYHNSLDFIRSNFKSIVTGEPQNLLDLHRSFKKTFDEKFESKVKVLLNKIFPYDSLKDGIFFTNQGEIWDNYGITKELQLQVCPYCNRSWVNTVIEGKSKDHVVNPQLDHFYSQKDYPLLMLSLYNLIPSCNYCNSRLKKDEKFDESFLNPYIEGYGSNVRFRTIAKNFSSSIGLDSEYSVYLQNYNSTNKTFARIEKNHKLFEIDRIYEAHGQIISELYRKSFISQNRYLEILSSQFPSANQEFAELYRMAIGNYYDEVEFSKRPFAKLTKDIAEQLGLI